MLNWYAAVGFMHETPYLFLHTFFFPLQKNFYENNIPNYATSFLSSTEMSDSGKNECMIEGWDLVEHPTLPPPSQSEDIEHWTRAMFIDATKTWFGATTVFLIVSYHSDSSIFIIHALVLFVWSCLTPTFHWNKKKPLPSLVDWKAYYYWSFL